MTMCYRQIVLFIIFVCFSVTICQGALGSQRVLRFTQSVSYDSYGVTRSWTYTVDGKDYPVSEKYLITSATEGSSISSERTAQSFIRPDGNSRSALIQKLIQGDNGKAHYETPDQLFAEIGSFHPLLKDGLFLSHFLFSNNNYRNKGNKSVSIIDIRACSMECGYQMVFIVIDVEQVVQLHFQDDCSKEKYPPNIPCAFGDLYSTYSYSDFQYIYGRCIPDDNRIFMEFCKGMVVSELLDQESDIAAASVDVKLSNDDLFSILELLSQTGYKAEIYKNVIKSVIDNGWIRQYQNETRLGVGLETLAIWEPRNEKGWIVDRQLHMDDLMMTMGELSSLESILTPVKTLFLPDGRIGKLTLFTPIFPHSCYSMDRSEKVLNFFNNQLRPASDSHLIASQLRSSLDTFSRFRVVSSDDLNLVGKYIPLWKLDVENVIIFCVLFNSGILRSSSLKFYYHESLDIFRIRLENFEDFWRTGYSDIRSSVLMSHPSVTQPFRNHTRVINLLQQLAYKEVGPVLVLNSGSLSGNKQQLTSPPPQAFATAVQIFIETIKDDGGHGPINEVVNQYYTRMEQLHLIPQHMTAIRSESYPI